MANRKLLPSQAYLQECFNYDPATGVVLWRVRPRHHFAHEQAWKRANTMFAGKVAGCVHYTSLNSVYREVGVNGKFYILTRVIVKIMLGPEPDDVDHIDGNTLNNVWTNLRPCKSSDNMKNRKLNSNNSQGMKGVTLHRGTGKYIAKISYNGTRFYLGLFDTAAEAGAAYSQAAEYLHGEFVRKNPTAVV